MAQPSKFATKGDIEAARDMLDHAFRNAAPRALRDVDFNDLTFAFAEYRVAVTADLLEALEPFARLGKLLELETEGFCGADELPVITEEGHLLDRLRVDSFRSARAAIAKATGAAE